MRQHTYKMQLAFIHPTLIVYEKTTQRKQDNH